MPDIKPKGNKWELVSDDGKKKEEFDTKGEAVQRLRAWEGHAAHAKEPKGFRHKKKSEVINELILLAEKLDNNDFIKEADQIDTLIKDAQEVQSQPYEELTQFLTKTEDYLGALTAELDKIKNTIPQDATGKIITNFLNNVQNKVGGIGTELLTFSRKMHKTLRK